jgi:protein-L-isoaspartate(D-aspartate) O-methyltransferase
MALVKREDFVAEDARELAYIDRVVPIGDGRQMSGPVVLGKLLTEMAPKAGERALVVVSGKGYTADVLHEMGLMVTALECSSSLAARARKLGIETVEGPLEEGWAKGAPYDLILIDGAIEHIPDAIIAQLAEHGRLGTALIDRGVSRLAVGRKAGGGFGLHTLADSGAAALPGFSRPPVFTF